MISYDIDCISILRFMDQYAGMPYCGENRRTEKNRDKMREIYVAGRTAASELRKMGMLCEEWFGLERDGRVKWLDGTNNRVRGYIWCRLKRPEYKDSPVSISLFADRYEEDWTARFRFSVEMDRDKTKEEDLEKYHRVLDMGKDATGKFDYIKDENGRVLVVDREEPIETIKRRLDDDVYQKIQICRLIPYSEKLTNRWILEEMHEAVSGLMKYYDCVIGCG